MIGEALKVRLGAWLICIDASAQEQRKGLKAVYLDGLTTASFGVLLFEEKSGLEPPIVNGLKNFFGRTARKV